MTTFDRISRFTLAWFSVTTFIFWLPTVRGAFDGPSYEWNLVWFGGQGMSGDYWFPLLAVIGSLAVMAGGWRGKTWAFIVVSVWSLLGFLAVVALAISTPDGFRFRGDAMGIDVSLAWIGPLLFGGTNLISISAAWQAHKNPSSANMTWNTQNWRWLAGLAGLLPIQFVLLRFGEPTSLNDQIGVLITVTQWFLIDRIFRPYGVAPAGRLKSSLRHGV
jgi:hypothetical protein